MTARLADCDRRSFFVRGIPFAVVLALCTFGVWLIPTVGRAAAPDSRKVRGTARRVLQSPVFRNLKPLKRPGTRRYGNRGNGQPGNGGGGGLPGGDGPGDGGNGNGNGEDGGNGNAGNDNGRGNNNGGNNNPDFNPRNNGNDGGRDFGGNDRFNRENGNEWNPGNNAEFDPPPVDQSTPSDSSMSVSPPSGFGGAILTVVQVIGWIIAAVVLCAMVYLIVMGIVSLIKWFQDRERNLPTETATTTAASDPLEPEKSPGELPADVYVSKARELAAAGKYREAVAQLLLGGMSHLERSGVVKFRQGLTHRDYVRNSRSNPAYYQAMRAMVRLYEPLGFGRRSPSRNHFEDSLSAYEAGFRDAASR